MMRKVLTAVLCAGLAFVCVFGAYVSSRAVSVLKERTDECLRLRAEVETLKAKLKRRPAPLLVKVKCVSAGERRILSAHRAGKAGTLALKNRNPLNIKHLGKQKWRGEIGRDAQGHVVFSSIHYGIRAAVLTLRSYQTKHNIETLDGIVERFCGGNPEYVAFLSRHMGLKPDEKFSITQRIPELIRWMSRFESGRELQPEMIAALDVLAKI